MTRFLILVPCLGLWLTACIPYPIYKTLQPAAQVTVLDGQGQPLPDATVTLIASAYPYGREKSRETKISGSGGTALFSAQREWRIEAIALHGSEEFFWNWCVRKEGFATVVTAHSSASGFEKELVVKLMVGESKECPRDDR